MKQPKPTRTRRTATFLVVALASLVTFAALGGVELARSAVGLAQYQYGKKVTICHKGKKTIRISVRAWPAHKRHGDTMGRCAVVAKKAKKHEQQGAAAEHKSSSGKDQGEAAKQGRPDKAKGEGRRAGELVSQAASGNRTGNGNGRPGGSGRDGGNGHGNGNAKGRDK